MSQILSIGPGFCFMKFRKKMFMKYSKGFMFFSDKIKTRALIKNLRHSSPQSNVWAISGKFHKVI